jgi:hypothetical protein
MWPRFMEQTSILERATSSGRMEADSLEPKYSLNIVSIYQDVLTGVWASQVCDQVAQRAEKNTIHSTWWKTSHLSNPKVLTYAALTAVQADVILVSIYDVGKLPVQLCMWIDEWLPRRSLPMGALITLFTVPGESGTQSNHAREYLRAIAQKSRMDFLLREHRLPIASRGFFYMEKAAERSINMKTVENIATISCRSSTSTTPPV